MPSPLHAVATSVLLHLVLMCGAACRSVHGGGDVDLDDGGCVRGQGNWGRRVGDRRGFPT